MALLSNVWAVPEAQFQPVYQRFLQASRGDTAQIEKAAEGFAALLKAEPANPVLMAFTGAATAMRANATWLPWRKLSFAEDGLSLIDKSLLMLKPEHDAVLQDGTPGALQVRLVAASTFLAVPGFMNRAARGNKLLQDIMASPLWAQTQPGFQGEVLLRAGKAALADQRLDEARKYLGEVIARKAPQAGQASALLKGMKGLAS
jgi:hypothetical protein